MSITIKHDDKTQEITVEPLAFGGSYWKVGSGLFLSELTNTTTFTLPNSRKWNDIAYGNNTFVAISYDQNYVVYSKDNGITWTEAAMPDTSDALDASSTGSMCWRSVSFANDKFYAVSGSYGVAEAVTRIAYSPDGINWEILTPPQGDWWSSIQYGNGVYMAAGTSSSADSIIRSTDGISFELTSPFSHRPDSRQLAYGDGKWVAFATSGSGTNGCPKIDVSTDGGASWFGIDNDFVDTVNKTHIYWCPVVYGKYGFVSIQTPLGWNGTGDITWAWSQNGLDWEFGSMPNLNYSKLVYGEDKYIALASDGTGYYCDSLNGLNNGLIWSPFNTAITSCRSAAYGNGRFVAINDGKSIQLSEDGINWYKEMTETRNAIVNGSGEDVTDKIKQILTP